MWCFRCGRDLQEIYLAAPVWLGRRIDHPHHARGLSPLLGPPDLPQRTKLVFGKGGSSDLSEKPIFPEDPHQRPPDLGIVLGPDPLGREGLRMFDDVRRHTDPMDRVHHGPVTIPQGGPVGGVEATT